MASSCEVIQPERGGGKLHPHVNSIIICSLEFVAKKIFKTLTSYIVLLLSVQTCMHGATPNIASMQYSNNYCKCVCVLCTFAT